MLQPALQLRVWVKESPVQTVSGLGDQAPLPQVTQDFVPGSVRIVAQLPVLQPLRQLRVCVKDCPEQTVERLGDQAPPQVIDAVTQCIIPVALRLVAQSPSLQPALQVRVWVKDCPEQTVAGLGDQAPPQVTQDFVPVALRLVEQSPSLQPALQVRVWVRDCPEQTVEALGDQAPPQETWAGGGFAKEQVAEFEPPWSPSQRQR